MKTSQKLREKIRQLQNQIRGQPQGVSLSIEHRRNPEPENLVSATISEPKPKIAKEWSYIYFIGVLLEFIHCIILRSKKANGQNKEGFDKDKKAD